MMFHVRSSAEWAHDVKDAVLEDFAPAFRGVEPLTRGGWALEITWAETVRHPWFGESTETRCSECLRWVRDEATVVAIALAMQARGLGAVMWRDGGGSGSRREFRAKKKGEAE